MLWASTIGGFPYSDTARKGVHSAWPASRLFCLKPPETRLSLVPCRHIPYTHAPGIITGYVMIARAPRSIWVLIDRSLNYNLTALYLKRAPNFSLELL
ncbi:hypothetical protein LIA77_03184 [Sarocladium implicatum]|nr:hypothetical protein LIA77_03184 [Sarocladium implicatum]